MMQTNRTESVRQPNPMKVEVKCDPDARFGGSTSLKPRGCHRDRIKQEIVLPKLQCSESAELLQKLRGRYHVQPTINSLSLTNGMRRRLGEINGREQVEEVDTVQLRMRPPGSSPDLRSSVFRKRLSVRIPSNTVANLARKFNTMTVNQGVTQLKGRVGNENGGSRESTKVSNGPPTAHRGRWKLHGHWIDNEEGVVMDFDSLTRSKSYSCEKVDKEMTEGELGIQNDNRSMSFSTGDIFEFIELDETTSSLDLAETTPNHDALGTESTPIEVNTHIRSSESNPITNEPRLTARNVNFFNSKITSIVERNDELEIPIQPNTVRTESATSLDDDSFQDAFETLPPNIQTADETNLEAAVTNEARMIVDSDSESVTNTAASVKSKVGCPNDCHSSQDTISHEEGAMCSGVGPAPSATGDSVAVSHGDYLCEPLKSRSVSLEMTENSLDKNEKENTNKKRRNIHTKTKLNLKKRNNISFLWCCQKSMSKLLKNASDVDEVTSRSKNKRNPDNSSNYENSLSSNGLHLLPHSSLKSRSVEELTDKRKTVQIDGKLGEFHLDFSSESLEESIARSLKMLNFNGESLLFAGEKQDLCLESEEEERTSSGSREDVINDLSSDISYCADSETNDQPSHRPLSTVSSSASLKTNDSSNSSDRCERSHIETPLRPHRSAQPCSMSESSRHGVVIDPVSIYISTPSESSRNDALLDQRSSFDTKSLSQFQLQQDNPISSRVSVSSTSSVICVNAEPVSDQSVGVCEELSDCDRTLAATATPLRHVHDEKEGGESQELSLWIGSEGAGSNPDVRYDSRSSTNDVRCESLSSTTDTISTVGSIKDVNESDGITEVVYKCSSECSEPEENIYEVIQCPDSQATPAPSNPPTAIVAASQPVHNPSALTSHRNSAPDVSQDKVLNTVGMKQKLKDNWNTTKQGLNRIRRRTLVPALADISKAIKVAASNSETNSSRDGDQRSSVPRPQPPITDTYSDSRGSSSERSAFYLDIARDLSSTCDQRCLFPVDDPIYNLAKCVEPLTQKFMYTGDRSSNGNSDASSDTIELVNDGADDIPTPVKADSDRLERVADDNTLTQNNSNGSGSTSSNSSRHSTSQFLGDLTNSNNVGLAGILSDSASSVHVHKTPTTLSGQSETHMELSVCLAAGSRESQNLQLSVLNSASTSHTALTSTPSAPDHSRASIISGCSSTHANFTISSSSDASSDAAYIAANSYLLNEEPLYQVYMRNPKGAIFDDESISSGSIYEEVGSLKSVPASNGPATKPVTPVIEVHQSDGQRSLWSHLPEVINSGVLDRLESDERRLQEAVFELISSEASYIRSLRLLVTHFANDPALRSQEDDNQQSTAVISKSDHDTLFSNSTKVLECSENFLAELQQCLHEDIMMKNVPAILEKHASNHFHSYVEYCAAQYLQDRKLEQLSESNQVFVEHLYRLESASCCQCLKLHSFLMLPMQRVTRLPLLVSATLCRLQETQPQFSGWQAAYTAVKQLAEKCNDEACRSQRLDELVSISNKFVFKNIKSFPLTNSDRSLVKKSTMIWSRTKVDDNKKTFGRKGTRHQMVNLFLFTDVLIITKKKSSDGLYTVLDYCPRSMLQMSEMDEKSDKFLLTLLCNHEEKTFELMLSCTAQSERLRWSEAISPSVDNDDSDETVYQSWDCPQVCVHTAYVARDGDELALDPGDVVKVLRKLPDGWLQGEKLIGSKNGWFPSSCCTEIVSEHTRARNLRQRYKLLRVTANYLEQQNRAAKSKQLRTK